MPTVLILLGMRFHYWANEHEPVHIHVEKGDAEATFVIEPEVKLISSRGFKTQELSKAERIIKDNKTFMAQHWRAFFDEEE